MAVFVIWLVILVVIIGNGWNTALWIFFIGSALLVVAAAKGNRQKKQPGAAEGTAARIDRMHYFDPDDHECPKCGARFTENTMVCPKCGAKFSRTVDKDDEFIEEMELWDDDE